MSPIIQPRPGSGTVDLWVQYSSKELALVALGNPPAIRTRLRFPHALSARNPSANILLRCTNRLRKITGHKNLKSQSESSQFKLTVDEVIVSNL
jgi:hypothetical protein